MTREEYLQLVKSAGSFQSMDAETQKKILEAEGQEMEHYIQIFKEEESLIGDAAKEFVDKSKEIVKDFKVNVTTIKKEHLKADESKARQDDEKKEEEILNSLNQL